MKIEFKNDVPIPPIFKGRKSRYDLTEMKVGEYFSINHQQDSGLYSLLKSFKKRYPKFKFVGKWEDGVSRIWRVK